MEKKKKIKKNFFLLYLPFQKKFIKLNIYINHQIEEKNGEKN